MKSTRRRAVDKHTQVRSGRIEIPFQNESAPASLREAIEGGASWWPPEATTDGADHFVIPR